MDINHLQNILAGSLQGTLMGPVVHSQEYDDKVMARVDVYTWEVHNGAKLSSDLPFGMFGSIVPMNMNKAKLQIRVVPGYPNAPVFPEVCTKEENIDQNIKSATVCRKVVAVNAAAETGTDIWESIIQPIDTVHGLRTTVKDVVLCEQEEFIVTRPSMIPERFRGLQQTVEHSIVVAGTAELPELAVGEELTAEEQVTKKSKKLTTRTLEVDAEATLDGQQAYKEGVVANTTATLSNTPLTADANLQVISSEVDELGTGQYVKDTVTAPTPWPEFKGSKLDSKFNIPIGFKERMVSPPSSTTSEIGVEYEPVNIHRSLRREVVVPAALFNSKNYSYPVRINLELPRVLKSIRAVWNSGSGKGDQDCNWRGEFTGLSYSLSCNLSDKSSGSASVMPEVIVELEEIWARRLPATAYVKLMPYPITEAQILGLFGALAWPVFHPVSHTFVCTGQKVACSVNVAVSASVSGSPNSKSYDVGDTASHDIDVSLSNNVIQIGPTIHKSLTVTGGASRKVSTSANAIIAVSGVNFPSATAARSISPSASGLISPSSLPAVRGLQDIPRGGLYLTDYHIEPYSAGYALVYSEIFNASVLA